MAYNLTRTALQGKLVANEPAQAMALEPVKKTERENSWHRRLERRPIQFMIAALLVILIGSFVELMPTLTIASNIPTIASVKPYTPLELQGRDLISAKAAWAATRKRCGLSGRKLNDMGSTAKPASLFMITLFYGDRNVRALIWPGLAVNIPMPGIITT